MRYSEAFKAKMVQRMSRPDRVSVYALSEDVGVHQTMLSRWLLEVSRVGGVSKRKKQPRRTKTSAGNERPGRRKPRAWTSCLQRSRIIYLGEGVYSSYTLYSPLSRLINASWEVTSILANLKKGCPQRCFNQRAVTGVQTMVLYRCAQTTFMLMVFALFLAGCGSDSSDDTALSANAGADQNVTGGAQVALDALESEPEALIASGEVDWSWNQIDGPSVTLSETDIPTFVTFTAPEELGDLVFELTLSNDEGDQDSDTVTVTVIDSGVTADTGPDQTATVGETVTLDGSGSTSSAGQIDSYSWQQSDSTGVDINIQNADQAICGLKRSRQRLGKSLHWRAKCQRLSWAQVQLTRRLV